MENLEAIKLVQSGKEMSFAEIKDVLDVFKEHKNTNSAEFIRLKQQARKKISGLKEKMPEMDLQESMAAVYAMKEFSTPEERKSEDFEKVLGSIEDRIVELKKENPTNIAPNQEQYEHPVEIKEETNASEINRNYMALENFDNAENPLDEKDEFFKQSRAGLEMLDIRDENGNPVDMNSEIVESARLQTISELVTSKEKVTPEEFRARLRDNIDKAVFSILNVDNAAKMAQKKDMKSVRQDLDTMLTQYNEGGKKNKRQVSVNNAIAVITDASQQVDKFANKLKAKFGEIPAVKGLKSRLSKLDDKLTKKYGKSYTKTKAVVQGVSGVVTDLGLVMVAGACGPVGLGVYSLYTFKKNVVPHLSAYQKANQETGISFSDYNKAHKKDAFLAGLYTVTSGLTAVSAGLMAAHNVVTNAGATTVDAVTKYASTGKIIAGGTAVAVKQSADVKKAFDNNENVGQAVGKAALSLALFGLMAGARENYDIVEHGDHGNVGGGNEGHGGITINGDVNIHNGDNINIDNCCDCEEVVYDNPNIPEEPVKPEPVKPEPVKPEPVKPEPVKPEPVKPEPVKPEPVKPEPVKPEPVKPTPPELAPIPDLIPDVDVEVEPTPIAPAEPEVKVPANGVRDFDDIYELMNDNAEKGIVHDNQDGLWYDQQKSNSKELDALAKDLWNTVKGENNCLDTPAEPTNPKEGAREYSSVLEKIKSEMSHNR